MYVPLQFNFGSFTKSSIFTVDKSTEELGLAALAQMPRDQAIEGAFAYQNLRFARSSLTVRFFLPLLIIFNHILSSTKLKAYLKPFADAKKVVTKEIIEEFFNAEKEKAMAR